MVSIAGLLLSAMRGRPCESPGDSPYTREDCWEQQLQGECGDAFAEAARGDLARARREIGGNMLLLIATD